MPRPAAPSPPQRQEAPIVSASSQRLSAAVDRSSPRASRQHRHTPHTSPVKERVRTDDSSARCLRSPSRGMDSDARRVAPSPPRVTTPAAASAHGSSGARVPIEQLGALHRAVELNAAVTTNNAASTSAAPTTTKKNKPHSSSSSRRKRHGNASMSCGAGEDDNEENQKCAVQ